MSGRIDAQMMRANTTMDNETAKEIAMGRRTICAFCIQGFGLSPTNRSMVYLVRLAQLNCA
jgi:hypothetical protein